MIIPSSEGISLGGKAFPSYVALTADGQMLIGEPARRQAAANPEGTATAFKRKMGQRVKVRLRGVATALIARNTPIPVRKTESFTTAADMQTGVTAKDAATGRAQSIRITGSTRLPEGEKVRMIKEAEKFAEEDRRRRDQAERLNNADAIGYQGERLLADFGDRASSDHRAKIELHIRDIKEALARKDVDKATAHAEALKTVLQEAGTAIYARAGAGAPQGGQPPRGGGEPPTQEGTPGRVVDAE